ncbi:MAG TPA: hypothetical protein VMV32_12390 [Ignavibacteriaceae bacterium]|nr:hypothetical protein [Ignavibacteriaceae bacterium]
MNYAYFLLAGGLGGLARGLIGAYKNSINVKKGEKINWKILGFNIVVSCVVGAVVGGIVDNNPTLALTSGYMGMDIIDSLIKLSK